MQDLTELERRITAALQRIGAGIEAMAPAAAVPLAAVPLADDPEVARLREALEAEKMLTAQLQERLRALKDRGGSDQTELEAKVDRMTRQLDVQGLEVKRMRKTVIALRENLRALRQAQSDGVADPEALNRAMAVELESVRVSRLAEIAEMDEILAELDPLIGEVRIDA
jgi:uncharacterized protein (DUF885 family)